MTVGLLRLLSHQYLLSIESREKLSLHICSPLSRLCIHQVTFKTMAPKRKAVRNEATASNASKKIEGPAKSEEHSTTDEKPAKKRKKSANNSEPQKEARRSGRSAPKSQASEEQLMNYLLSKDAEELCRPDEESQDIKNRGNIRTYSGTVMNLFEELLCAAILSRPISHRLGLRSIRTILNEPYNFTSARFVKNAGSKKHHQAFWDARTQHKQKSAEEVGQIADVVLEKFTAKGDKEGTQLQKALDDNGGDVDKALDSIKESIKGVGPTGIKIFLRRVQWLWQAGYPYVDDRTQLSLRKLGLPVEPEDLENAVDKYWSKLDTKRLAGDNEAAKKRRAFTTVLERAIGADLEGKIDALLEAAASKQ